MGLSVLAVSTPNSMFFHPSEAAAPGAVTPKLSPFNAGRESASCSCGPWPGRRHRRRNRGPRSLVRVGGGSRIWWAAGSSPARRMWPWAQAITYRHGEGWLYLVGVLDLGSCRLLGYSMAGPWPTGRTPFEPVSQAVNMPLAACVRVFRRVRPRGKSGRTGIPPRPRNRQPVLACRSSTSGTCRRTRKECRSIRSEWCCREP
jgi:hypothetical protein